MKKENKKNMEPSPVVEEVIDDREDIPQVEKKTKLDRKTKRLQKKMKMVKITPETDIKYRGPLSYRHLRIIGWLAFAISQIAVILALAGKVDPNIAAGSEGWRTFLNAFHDLMMPLFLVANFSFILRGHTKFKSLFIKFGVLSLAFAAGYYLIYEHYVVGFVGAFVGDRALGRDIIEEMILGVNGGSAKTLNVFIDLLLCTAFYYFLVYKPKKFFQGKKIILFRLLAILPVIYEAVSLLFKLLAANDVIATSPYAYPFFTCKPPMAFVAFLAIAIYFAHRKQRYNKLGGTDEQYEAFLKTNYNSWQVSRAISTFFILAALIDVLIIFIVVFAGMVRVANLGDGVPEELMFFEMFRGLNAAFEMGFGGSIGLVLAIPFVLLFSYTKEHDNPTPDLIIPLAGIGLVAFVYLEGLFQISKLIPDWMAKLISKFIGGGKE